MRRVRGTNKSGHRSHFETLIINILETEQMPLAYEPGKIPFVEPAKHRTYKPDVIIPPPTDMREVFRLGSDRYMVIEIKGKFDTKDRAKHDLLRKQYPNLDIRFVFQRPHQKIRKGSKTSYAMWCDKRNIKWTGPDIPRSWIKEMKLLLRKNKDGQ